MKKYCIVFCILFSFLKSDSIESKIIESSKDSKAEIIESKQDSKKDSIIESKQAKKAKKEQEKKEKQAQKAAIKQKDLQYRISKIEDKNERRMILDSKYFSIPYPFFYTQFGVGFSSLNALPSSNDMPNFSLAFGFNQQINLWYFYLGVKAQVGYEVALKGAGENTNVFQLLGFGTSVYVGIYRFIAHVGGGYEIFNYANAFGANADSYQDGISVIAGLGFIISKHSSIDLSAKFLTDAGIKNAANTAISLGSGILYSRFMLSYEFRF